MVGRSDVKRQRVVATCSSRRLHQREADTTPATTSRNDRSHGHVTLRLVAFRLGFSKRKSEESRWRYTPSRKFCGRRQDLNARPLAQYDRTHSGYIPKSTKSGFSISKRKSEQRWWRYAPSRKLGCGREDLTAALQHPVDRWIFGLGFGYQESHTRDSLVTLQRGGGQYAACCWRPQAIRHSLVSS
jgi:hypothetical protein